MARFPRVGFSVAPPPGLLALVGDEEPRKIDLDRQARRDVLRMHWPIGNHDPSEVLAAAQGAKQPIKIVFQRPVVTPLYRRQEFRLSDRLPFEFLCHTHRQVPLPAYVAELIQL